MRKSIIIGSRGSRLALLQAESVLATLKQANPGIDFRLTKIVTTGDRNLTLSRMPGYGVFVKELEEALLDGRIDLAVHSLKDMPTEIPEGLSLAAVTMRLDPRDILVSTAGKLADLTPGSTIGTGSSRRTVQLLNYRPDLKVQPVRGNVDTRLRKVYSNELGGIILAAAAMIRLGLESKITEYLSVDSFLPAVGQGTLGVEIRSEDGEVAELVRPLNHESAWRGVIAERTFLQAMGGGCRAPIAALGTVDGDTLLLQGMIASVSGGNILRATEKGSSLSSELVGRRLAHRMLEMGASQFIMEAEVQ